MKKNFVVTTANKQQYNALMDWSVKNGYRWNNGQAGSEYRYEVALPLAERIIFKEDGRICCKTANNLEASNGPVVEFTTFAAIQGIEVGPEPMEVVLTKDYSAVIDYTAKTVTIDCQVIPFTKINEVYACTKKYDAGDWQEGAEAAIGNALYALFSTRTSAAKALKIILENGYKVVKA